MPNLPQAALLESLGWTILNSWWQFGILWLLYLFIKKVLPGLRSAQRYNLLIFLLMTGILWSVYFFFVQLAAADSNELNQVASWNLPFTDGGHFQAASWLDLALPYISIIYLSWLTIKLLQFFRQLWFTQSVTAEGLQKAPVKWRIYLNNLSARMNITVGINIWISDRIDTPMIIGWIKPIILLPLSALSQLSTAQLEAVLLHELAHIKRNDYFWNLLVALTELVYYHNPFTRALVQAIREEREHSCDDWVLQFSFIPAEYAAALLQLEKNRQSKESRLLLAARGNSRKLLLIRVQRMLNLPQSRPESGWKLGVLAALTTMVAMAAMIGSGVKTERFGTTDWEERSFFRRENSVWAAAWAGSAIPLQSFAAKFPVLQSGKKVANQLAAGNFPGNEQQAVAPQPDIAQRVQKSVLAGLPGKEAEGIAVTGEISGQAVEKLTWVASGKEPYRVDLLTASILPETRAFTHAIEKISLPEEASFQYMLPYVPRNSFQANLVTDTLPGNTAAPLSELKAREAAIQTKLALEQINWEKLGAELKEKGAGAEAIRFELEKALAKLDWNRIQSEAKLALRQLEEARLLQKFTATLQLQEEYKSREAELKKLHQELEQQQENLQKQLLLQEKELQKSLRNRAKGKKVVHI